MSTECRCREYSVFGLDALLSSARPSADFRLVVPDYLDAMGMLAAWIPARRATSIDPVAALREP